MKKKTQPPKTPIILEEGLRIDFRTLKNEPLNYLRFEHTNCEDDAPTYIGAIRKTEKAKLKKLRSAIDFLLGDE